MKMFDLKVVFKQFSCFIEKNALLTDSLLLLMYDGITAIPYKNINIQKYLLTTIGISLRIEELNNQTKNAMK